MLQRVRADSEFFSRPLRRSSTTSGKPICAEAFPLFEPVPYMPELNSNGTDRADNYCKACTEGGKLYSILQYSKPLPLPEPEKMRRTQREKQPAQSRAERQRNPNSLSQGRSRNAYCRKFAASPYRETGPHCCGESPLVYRWAAIPTNSVNVYCRNFRMKSESGKERSPNNFEFLRSAGSVRAQYAESVKADSGPKIKPAKDPFSSKNINFIAIKIFVPP